MKINCITNTGFKGTFERNRHYEDLKNNPKTNPKLVEKFEDTLKTVESVDDKMKYYISATLSYHDDDEPCHRYYLMQEANGSIFSKKIIADQGGRSPNKTLMNFEKVLSKKYRPFQKKDDELKEEIYNMLENQSKFSNNYGIREVLNLPYTTRSQLKEFKKNLEGLSQSNDDKIYYVTATVMHGDVPETYYSFLSREKGWLTGNTITRQNVTGTEENGMLDSINAYLESVLEKD